MKKKISKLFIIDPQYDFIEGGALPVEGGKDALDKLVEYIKKNNLSAEDIIVSMDVHNPSNLGFKENWKGDTRLISEGKPIPFNEIPRIEPTFKYYDTESLKTRSRKYMTCWPKHCIKGTRGCDIYDPIWDEIVRMGAENRIFMKGLEDTEESYSIFSHGDLYLTQLGEDLKEWASNQKPGEEVTYEFIFAGLAEDYCVMETLLDMYNILRHTLSAKVEFKILKDCTAKIDKDQDRYGHMIAAGEITLI